jgi:hypothetical protein
LEPNGFESLLEAQIERARVAEEAGEVFELTAQDVAELQAEGIQYYHRYITFYQLEEFEPVVRDTHRNLEMFDFVTKHAPDAESAWVVEQFRPYVTMMNCRAKSHLALARGDVAAAVALVEKGLGRIENFYRESGNDEMRENSPELKFLNDWLEELRGKTPVSPLDQMRTEMQQAIHDEAYERAAELRDQIRALENAD